MEEYREALRLEPNAVINYGNLGTAYASLNRLEEAEAVYRQAEERKLESEYLLVSRYQLAFLKGDAAQMAQFAAASMGKPGTEDLLLAMQAETEATVWPSSGAGSRWSSTLTRQRLRRCWGTKPYSRMRRNDIAWNRQNMRWEAKDLAP